MAAERLRIRNRDMQALGLKLAGANYDEIATSLGYADSKNAWRAVQRLLAAQAQPTAELRAEEVARLDALLRAWWTKAIGKDDAPPDRIAAEMVLKISERRGRLLGLDKPYTTDIEDLLRAEAERLGEDPDEAVKIAREVASDVRRGRIRLVS